MTAPLRVAMIGHAFMGAAHSHAWRTVGRVFPLPRPVEPAVVCGRDPVTTAAAADRLGWAEASTDWQAVVGRDDVDVVDICTPGDSHAQIALAALAAGKHVLCEKPLANTVAQAEQMADAARRAREAHGALAMVGFTYRRVPALSLAAELVREGRIGEVRHVRAQYLQDWIVDPQFPLVWRLRKEHAGSGALGDIGAHAIDLLQFVTGESLVGVSAARSTFVPRRPLPAASSGLSASAQSQGSGEDDGEDGRYGDVTVDDATAFTGRLDGGAMVVVEATRFATGRKNALRLEINGSLGSLAFDLEAMNELHVYDNRVPAADAGFRRILVTEPEHPYVSAWWPPGHGLGYDHAFVHQAHDLVTAICAGEQPRPSFDEGLAVQRILEAVERSADDASRWTPITVERAAAGPS